MAFNPNYLVGSTAEAIAADYAEADDTAAYGFGNGEVTEAMYDMASVEDQALYDMATVEDQVTCICQLFYPAIEAYVHHSTRVAFFIYPSTAALIPVRPLENHTTCVLTYVLYVNNRTR